MGRSPVVEAPVLTPPGCLALPWGCGGISPNPKHQEESATLRDLRPQAPRRVQITEGPVCAPIALRRVSA